MNKKHWNTIILDGEMKDEILKEMIDESYDLVVSKLTKKELKLFAMDSAKLSTDELKSSFSLNDEELEKASIVVEEFLEGMIL